MTSPDLYVCCVSVKSPDLIIIDKAWLVPCRTLFLQELETCCEATKNTKSESIHKVNPCQSICYKLL